MRSWAELERAQVVHGGDGLSSDEWADLMVAEVIASAGVDVPAGLLEMTIEPSAVAVSAVAIACGEGPWFASAIAKACGVGAESLALALRRAHRSGLLVVDVAGVSRKALDSSLVRVGPRLRPMLGDPRVRKGGR